MRWFGRNIHNVYKTEYFTRGDQTFEVVTITTGKYRDVSYYYGIVRFVPDENGTPVMRFDYFQVRNPKGKNIKTNEFKRLAGDILVDLIKLRGISENTTSLKDTGELYE